MPCLAYLPASARPQIDGDETSPLWKVMYESANGRGPVLDDLEADELEPLLLWSSSDANAAAVAVANASTATSSSTASGALPASVSTDATDGGADASTAPPDSTQTPGAASSSSTRDNDGTWRTA